ncbi:hypothetical protein Tco_0170428 [Tanacetum coccineum]
MNLTKANLLPALDFLEGMKTSTTVPYTLQAFHKSRTEEDSGKLVTNTDLAILETSSALERLRFLFETSCQSSPMEKRKDARDNLD